MIDSHVFILGIKRHEVNAVICSQTLIMNDD